MKSQFCRKLEPLPLFSFYLPENRAVALSVTNDAHESTRRLLVSMTLLLIASAPSDAAIVLVHPVVSIAIKTS